MKFKITQDQFTALSPDLQSEYEKQDDGSYQLKVEGGEDTGALKRAAEHEKSRRKKAEDKLAEKDTKITELESELGDLREAKSKSGDEVVKAEQKLREQHAKEKKALEDRINSTEKALQDQMAEGEARRLANELAGDNADLLLPHIRTKLVGQLEDGKAVTKVLGDDGQPSATTLDELKNSFLSNEKFSAIVIGTKGSGGGAGGSRRGGGAPTAKKLSEMSATEEAEFAVKNPDKYAEMVQQADGVMPGQVKV